MKRWGSGDDGGGKKQGQIVLRFTDGSGDAPQMKMDGAVKLHEGTTLKCTEVLNPGASQQEAWASAVEPLVEPFLEGSSANVLHMGEPHPLGRRHTLFGAHPVNDVHPLTEDSPSYSTDGSFIRTLRAIVSHLENLTTSGLSAKIWTEAYTLKVALCGLKGDPLSLEISDMWSGAAVEGGPEYQHTPTAFFGCGYLPVKQVSHTLWTMKGALPEELLEETFAASIVLRNKETGKVSVMNFVQPTESHRAMFESALQTWVVGMQARSSVPKSVTELFAVPDLRFSLTLSASLTTPSPSLKRLFVTATRVHNATQSLPKKTQTNSPQGGLAKRLRDGGMKVIEQQRLVGKDEAAGMALKLLTGAAPPTPSPSGPNSDAGEEGKSKNLERVVTDLQRQLSRREGELLRVKSEKQQTDTIVGKHIREIQNLTKQAGDLQRQLASKEETIGNLNAELDDMSSLRQLLTEANEQNKQLETELQEEKKKTREQASSIDDLREQLEIKVSHGDKTNTELLERIAELEALNAMLEEARNEAEAARKGVTDQLKIQEDRNALLERDVDSLSPFVAKYEETKQAHDTLQERNAHLTADLASLEDQLRDLRNENVVQEAASAQLLFSETEMAKELERLQGELNASAQSLDANRRETSLLQGRLEQASKSGQDEASDAQQLRSELALLQTEAARLTDALSAEVARNKKADADLTEAWDKIRTAQTEAQDSARDKQQALADLEKAQRHADSLEARATSAEKALSDKNNALTDAQKELQELRDRLNALSGDSSVLEGENQRLRQEGAEEQARRRKAEADLNDALAKLRDSTAHADDLQGENRTLHVEEDLLRRENAALKQDITAAQADADALRVKAESYERLASEAGLTLSEHDQELATLRDNLARAKADILRLNEELAEKRDTLSKASFDLERCGRELSDEKEQRAKLQTEANEAWRKLREEKTRSEELQREASSATMLHERLKAENAALAAKIAHLQKQGTDQTEAAAAQDRELLDLRDTLATLKHEAHTAASELARLRKERDDEQARREKFEAESHDSWEKLRDAKARADALQRDNRNTDIENGRLTRDNEGLVMKVTSLEALGVEAATAQATTDRELGQARDQLAQHAHEMEMLRSDLERLRKECQDEAARTAKADTALKEATVALREARNNADQHAKDARNAAADRDTLQRDNDSYAEKVAQLERLVAEAGANLNSTDRDMLALKDNLLRETAQRKRLEVQCDALTADVKALQEKLAKERNLLPEAEQRVQELQSQLADAEHAATRQQQLLDDERARHAKADASNKDLSKELRDANNTAQELRRRVTSLERDLQQAEKDADTRLLHAEHEKERVAQDLTDALERIDRANATQKELSAEVSDLQARLRDMKRDNEVLTQDNADVVAEAAKHADALQREIDHLRATLTQEQDRRARCDADLLQAQQDLADLKNDLTRAGRQSLEELKSLEKAVETAERERRKLSADIERLEDKNDKLETNLAEQKTLGKEAAEELSAERRAHEKTERSKIAEAAEADRRHAALERDILKLQSDLDAEKAREQQHLERIKGLNSELQALRDDLNTMRRASAALERELQDQILDCEKRTATAERDHERTKAELEATIIRLDAAELDCKQKDAREAALQESLQEMKDEVERLSREKLESVEAASRQAASFAREKAQLESDLQAELDRQERGAQWSNSIAEELKELRASLASEHLAKEELERALAECEGKVERALAAAAREREHTDGVVTEYKKQLAAADDHVRKANEEAAALKAQLGDLQREAEQLQHDADLVNASHDRKAGTLAREVHRLEAELRNEEERRQAEQQRANGLADEVRALKARISDDDSRKERELQDAAAAAHETARTLRGEIHALEAAIEDEKRKAEALVADMQRMREETAAERKKNVAQSLTAAEELSAAQEQIHNETEKRRLAETEKDKLAWEASRIQAEADALGRKAEDMELNAKHHEDLMNQALAKATECEKRRHEAAKAAEKTKHELAEALEQLHHTAHNKDQLDEEVARLMADLHERKLERERDREELRNMQYSMTDLEKQCTNLTQKCDTLEAELQRYLVAKADAEDSLKRLQLEYDACVIKADELQQRNAELVREADIARKQQQQGLHQGDSLAQKLAEMEQQYRIAQDEWTDAERAFKDKLHTADAVVSDLEQQLRQAQQQCDTQRRDHDAAMKRNREVERAAEAARATAEAARRAAEGREASALDKVELAEQRLLAKERDVEDARERETRALQLAEAEKRNRINVGTAATEAEDEAAELRRSANEMRDDLRATQRTLRDAETALKKAEQELELIKTTTLREGASARDEITLLRDQLSRERSRSEQLSEELSDVRARQQLDTNDALAAVKEADDLRGNNRRISDENKALIVRFDSADQALADMKIANSELDQALHKAEVELEGLRRTAEKNASLENTLLEVRNRLTDVEHNEAELLDRNRHCETELDSICAAVTEIISGGNGTSHSAAKEVVALCRYVKDLTSSLAIVERRVSEVSASASESKAALLSEVDTMRARAADLDLKNTRLHALHSECAQELKLLQVQTAASEAKHAPLAEEAATLRKALAAAELSNDEYRRHAHEIEDGAIHGIAGMCRDSSVLLLLCLQNMGVFSVRLWSVSRESLRVYLLVLKLILLFFPPPPTLPTLCSVCRCRIKILCK